METNVPHDPGSVTEIDETAATETKWPKVIGVISLIYAVGGLLCQSSMAVGGLLSEWLMSLGNLDVDVPAVIKIQSAVMLVLTWGLGLVMLFGAIGLLRRRRRGVSRLKQWVVLRLAVLILGTGVGIIMLPANIGFQEQVMEASNKNTREAGRPDLVQEFDEEALWRRSMITTAVMTAVFAAYPLFLGFYLSRNRITEEIADWDS